MIRLSASMEELEALLGTGKSRKGCESWEDGEFSFELTVANTQLKLTIIPSLGDVWVSVSAHGSDIYQFEGQDLTDVRVHRNGRSNFVEIVVGESDSLAILVSPTIEIKHKACG